MNAFLRILFLLAACCLFTQCEKEDKQDFMGDSGTFMDSRDDQVYNWLRIGKQIWMAENLNYETDSGSCVYDDNLSLASTYGRLYTWDKACESSPEGWHTPSDAEWEELRVYLGGDFEAGSSMKEAGTAHWKHPNEGATNESGFTALPGGYRTWRGFVNEGEWASFWSSTEGSELIAYNYVLYYENSWFDRFNSYKTNYYSVRCIKDP